MRFIDRCPVCGSSSYSPFMRCEDHTVSHETFHLVQCRGCQLVMTNPQPEVENLPHYYNSDNYISHATTARSPFQKIYHVARNRNTHWKVNLVKHRATQPRNANTHLLDFGCGTGHFLMSAQHIGFQVTGVEPSQKAREFASSLTGTTVLDKLSAVDSNFDVITLWHVLEHIPDLNEILSMLNSRLKQNGTMFIAVPNYHSNDAVTYGPHWAAFDVPRHLWHFNIKSMYALLGNHGLKVDEIIPMKMDAYYVSILSEQYQNAGKPFASFVKGLMRGWQSNRRARKTKEYSSLIYVSRK